MGVGSRGTLSVQNPNVMRIAPEGWKRRLTGAPIVLIFTGVLFLQARQAPADTLSLLWLSLPLLVGLGLLSYRSGHILDRGAGRLIHWRGLLLPLWRSEQPLSGTSHVYLGRERRGSGRNSRTCYPVQLRGTAGHRVELQAPGTYLKARKLAESIARFLTLELHDVSGGERVIRQAAHLDESLRERYRRRRELTRMPRQADDAVARVETPPGGGQRIVIPAVGLHPAHAGLLVPVLLFMLFILPVAPSIPAGLAMLGLFIAATGLLVLHLARYREEISVDPDGISLRAGGLWPSRRRMAASEIEEILAPAGQPHFARQLAEAGKLSESSGLDVARLSAGLAGLTRAYAALGATSQVVLRGDRGSLGLGRHLPAAEKPWLQAALTHLLVSQPGGAEASPLGRYGSARKPAVGRGIWVLAILLILMSAAWEAGWLDDLPGRFPGLLR